MPYVSPYYPTTIPNMTDLHEVANDVDDVIASDHNDLAHELIALMTSVGVLPQGDMTSLTERLAVSLYNDGTLKTGSWFTGSPTWPTSPGTPGMMWYDNTHFYICYLTNLWRRQVIFDW